MSTHAGSEESGIIAEEETLNTLTTSLTATIDSVGISKKNGEKALTAESSNPAAGGISLLAVKNDLLLEYLHNLSFLVLLRLKKVRFGEFQDAVVKLVELRVLMEKGVGPIEERLRYEIEKALDAVRKEEMEREKDDQEDEEEDDEDDEDEDEENWTKTKNQEGRDGQELAFRPNPSMLMKSATADDVSASAKKSSDGIYKPPRISATAMPQQPDASTAASSSNTRKPARSRALDDFITTQLSSAPLSEPSIGTNIVRSGRGPHQSEREARIENQRREYEESHLVRLPKPSKKMSREERRRYKSEAENSFGGEDWRAIGDLNAALLGGSKKSGGALERSRKRKDDGNAGGFCVGERYEGRKRMASKRRKT
jgi:U3 small nucleolar ribonucleoprotein protein LCP5